MENEPTEEQIKKQKDRLRVVTILHLILGAWISFAGVLIVFALMGGSPGGRQTEFPFNIVLFLGFLPTLLILAVGIGSLVSGWAIPARRYWSLSLLVSTALLLFVPIGTIIGIFSIWVLMSPITRFISYDSHRDD